LRDQFTRSPRRCGRAAWGILRFRANAPTELWKRRGRFRETPGRWGVARGSHLLGAITLRLAIRTARSRISGENLFVVLLVIAPPSQKLEPPTNPGRFRAANRRPVGASRWPASTARQRPPSSGSGRSFDWGKPLRANQEGIKTSIRTFGAKCGRPPSIFPEGPSIFFSSHESRSRFLEFAAKRINVMVRADVAVDVEHTFPRNRAHGIKLPSDRW